jgi:hypothetical protein
MMDVPLQKGAFTFHNDGRRDSVAPLREGRGKRRKRLK